MSYSYVFIYVKAFSTVGTPDYIAPEVLLKKGYGMECDWLVEILFLPFLLRTLVIMQLMLVWIYTRTLDALSLVWI